MGGPKENRSEGKSERRKVWITQLKQLFKKLHYCLTQNSYKSMQTTFINNRYFNRLVLTKTLLIMKFTAILLLIACLQLSAKGVGQGITLSEENASLSKIFRSIKKQTGYTFFFDEAWIRQADNVTINVKEESLEKVLDICFNNQPLSYSIVGTTIVIKLNEQTQKEKIPIADMPMPIEIKGVITDENNVGLQGVSVTIKGSEKGTTTDVNGNFAIQLPDDGGVLVFSYVGYEVIETAVKKSGTLSFSLKPREFKGDEIVVIGYGTQKKKDMTGSVATISGRDLSKVAGYSVDQALQGKAAGVYVITNSGEPGAGLSVRVRGMGGFGGAEPLYVVDGVILTYIDNSTLNMADIESINVLKDASASAIYGARAGNGVVIITTKRGRAETPKLSFDTYYGIQEVAKKIDMMNASEYAAQSNESRVAAGTPTYNKFANPSSLGEGTDWQDAIFRSAMINNYQLSLSGGSDKVQYYISGGYLKQDGIIINSKFKRYSLKINTDAQATRWLKLGNSLTLSRTQSNGLTNGVQDRFDGIVAKTLHRSPTLPIYNADGSWGGPAEAIDVSFLGQNGNPVRKALLKNNPEDDIRILGNVYSEVRILKNLTFKTNAGFDYLLANFNEFQASYIEGALPVPPNQAFQSKSTNANFLAEHTLTFNKDFGLNHHFVVLAGYTSQINTNEIVDARSMDHLTTTLTTVNAGSSIDRQANGARYENSYESYLGRINYSFADKYLIAANIRRDGSSVFSAENKYAVFPSFSAGWRLSREKFIQKIAFINDLKLRGSWGQTGFDGNLGGTEYATIGSGFLYNFGGTVVGGMTANVIPNPSLKWETVSQTDFGIDLSVLNNRLSVTADYFIKRYTDMITQKPVPIYAGISNTQADIMISQSINSATVVNKGFEFAVNYNNRTGSLNYDLGFNLTTFSNKIVKLDDYISGGYLYNTPQGFLTRTEEGYSVGEFYGYITDGIFQNQKEVDDANALNGDPTVFFQNQGTAPGDIRFKDLNSDHIIDEQDRTYIGSPIPDYIFGFIANLSFKQFDLNLSLQGVQGNKIVNSNRFVIESAGGTENKSRILLQRWTPANPSNTVPRVILTDPNFNDRPSSRFVENGSYLRLRTLQIGYTFPNTIIKKLSISSARVYLSAQNLFTFTKYTGYNPDIGAQAGQNKDNGIDDSIYPQNRIFMAGTTVGF